MKHIKTLTGKTLKETMKKSQRKKRRMRRVPDIMPVSM